MISEAARDTAPHYPQPGNGRDWLRQVADEPSSPYSRAERFLPIVSGVCLLVGDIAVVQVAFLLAHWVRFIAPLVEAAALGLEQYSQMGLAVGLLSAALFALHGLYDEDRAPGVLTRVRLIVTSMSTALVLAATVAFFLGDQRFSRLWFAAGWIFAVVGLSIWRSVALQLYLGARDALTPISRVLIVGADALAEELARDLGQRYRVVGCVDNGSDLDSRSKLALLGPIAQLEQIVHDLRVDEIIVGLPPQRREQIDRVIGRGFRRQVKVKMLPDVIDLLPERVEVMRLAGRPCLGFTSAARVSWLKRVLDLLVSVVVLVPLAPLLLAVAFAIKLDSRGPLFYRQQRIGRDGRRFQILKFRSMRQDADRLLGELSARNEASGPLFKMRRDPRVTRVGRLIRRLSIDELPQLFNVIKGEMSLVGPRPALPSEVEQYEDWQIGRFRAAPGITGLWQVSGRSEVSFNDMVRLDLYYVRNWSLALDLEILLRTIPAVLTNRGAY